jgi:hypothetical protein
MMNRTPPTKVREQLRKEVNFGCPVKGCGSPYLAYHHFDPPWNEKYHHNPEGMIALCMKHHSEADGRAWTKAQLREMKANPFISSEVAGRFNWLRQDIIVIAGGNVIQNPHAILELYGEKVVWLEKYPDGYRLNMTVKDSEGRLVLKIQNNDWIAYNKRVVDVFCPPSGKEVSVTSKDRKTSVAIRFDDLSTERFRELLRALSEKNAKIDEKIDEEINKIVGYRLHHHDTAREAEIFANRMVGLLGSPSRVTTLKLIASLHYHGKTVEIKEEIFEAPNLTSYGNLMRNLKSVFIIDEKGVYIG